MTERMYEYPEVVEHLYDAVIKTFTAVIDNGQPVLVTKPYEAMDAIQAVLREASGLSPRPMVWRYRRRGEDGCWHWIFSEPSGLRADLWEIEKFGQISPAEIEAGRAGAERVREAYRLLGNRAADLCIENGQLRNEIIALRQPEQPADADHPRLRQVFIAGWSAAHGMTPNHSESAWRDYWSANLAPWATPRAAQPSDGAQPAPDMVQRHEKQLAAWVDAHPVFGPAHRAYEASKAAQPAGRAKAVAWRFKEASWSDWVVCGFRPMERHDYIDALGVIETIATPPTAGAVDDGGAS